MSNYAKLSQPIHQVIETPNGKVTIKRLSVPDLIAIDDMNEDQKLGAMISKAWVGETITAEEASALPDAVAAPILKALMAELKTLE